MLQITLDLKSIQNDHMHSQTYGRVAARVHEKVLVLFQESCNATTIFLQLCHFLLDVFQEVHVGPIKSKLPYILLLSSIAVELTKSSATQNHVVFQYGASGILHCIAELRTHCF